MSLSRSLMDAYEFGQMVGDRSSNNPAANNDGFCMCWKRNSHISIPPYALTRALSAS